MKKIAVAALVCVIGLGIMGCSSAPSLDREVSIGDEITYKVSSQWAEATGDIGSDTQSFDTGKGTLSVSYFANYVADGDATHEGVKESALASGYYSNWQELSREEKTIDGAKCIIYQYSFTHEKTGDTVIKSASITRGDFSVLFNYGENSADFDESIFDSVIDSVKISG